MKSKSKIKKPTLEDLCRAAKEVGAVVTCSLEPKPEPTVIVRRAIEIQETIKHGLAEGQIQPKTVNLLCQATIVTLNQALALLTPKPPKSDAQLADESKA